MTRPIGVSTAPAAPGCDGLCAHAESDTARPETRSSVAATIERIRMDHLQSKCTGAVIAQKNLSQIVHHGRQITKDRKGIGTARCRPLGVASVLKKRAAASS
jgi:hypothetical protein